MSRYRLGSLAVLAGLGLLQGCASSDSCNGGLLHRLGFGRHGACECTPACNGHVVIDGANGPPVDGPLLEPPPAVGTEPPMAPVPRPYMPQAQPMPAGPVSKLRSVDQGQK
jgi:hypothetical protein